MGQGPLDHPRLLEIEERLDRAEIDAAQRLLADLGDLPVHRAAITYFATRLLYQRGRLDTAGVVERLRDLMRGDLEFPQASAMLSAAERGTLRPDREGFLRATLSPEKTHAASPSQPAEVWIEPPRKESSAPTLEIGLGAVETDHDELSLEAPREKPRSFSMPEIPRAPMVPRFTPPANLAPSYAPGARTESAPFELELELPGAPRDTIRQSEQEPPSQPHATDRPLEPLELVDFASKPPSLPAPPRSPESTLARARTFWDDGARGDALICVERLEHAPLLDPELRGECARFLLDLCEPERALSQARRAAHDDPGSPVLQLLVICALVRSARRTPNHQATDEAERMLARMRSHKGPLPPLVQALRASVLAEKGEADRAITTAQLALGLDNSLLDAEAAISLSAARLGRADDARTAYERVCTLNPGEAAFLSDRLEQLGVTVRDETDPSSSRGLPPNSAAKLWDKAEVDLFMGDHPRAIAAFERGAARELRGLVGESATDAIPLLATMAAGFFTTEPVWRHFAPFDLSLSSLARLEAVLDVLYGRAPREALTSAAYPAQVMLACYFGECVRQAYGGRWQGSLAEPDAVFVSSNHGRFAPFRELRLRLEQGKPLSAALSTLPPGVRKPAVSVPMAPPAPWDPAEWPSPRLLPKLGVALSQSVVELYCAEFGGAPLDRSLKSVNALDQYVSLLAPLGVFPETDARWLKRAAALTGAYLGEVLCHARDGRWQDTGSHASSASDYAVTMPNGTTAYPVEQALARLTGADPSPLARYVSQV